MEFGIMFFSSTNQQEGADKYSLLKRATAFADTHDFCCVWTPERHFAEFGGLFPNPSVISSALAMITNKLQLRAGSLISPLHNPIRIAEEWAVVDQLSGGRAAISFGSGWNVDDFVFFPERYSSRQAVMYEQIQVVHRLWNGEPLTQKNSFGKDVEVRLFPRPVQQYLPTWITTSGHPDTFQSAGAAGYNLLTHLLGQDIQALSEKIALYRRAREESGFSAETGIVSLMLHTFLGSDIDSVRAKVRGSFREYLKSAVKLERSAAAGGGVISGGRTLTSDEISSADMEELLDIAFERYFRTGALMGTVSSCKNMIRELEQIGVNEVACLIDFGVEDDAVMESLGFVDLLRESCSGERTSQMLNHAIQEFSAELE
jgi:natural product biosynthesis luciferase-like monooxygenase protein